MRDAEQDGERGVLTARQQAKTQTWFAGVVRVRVDDVRLHVSVLGEQWRDGVRLPVIVALHGGPGVDAAMLRATVAPAATYAQVVVPDQRGHGRSDRGEPEQWNLDRWADDVAGLVEVLGLDRPVVLGTSFGGFVAQRYLARHPGQPAGAVLIATCSRAPDEAEVVERFRSFGGDVAAAAMTQAFRGNTSPAQQQLWGQVCAPLLALRPLGPELALAAQQRVDTVEVAQHFAARLAHLELRPGLTAARCPVLVLAGERDPLNPPPPPPRSSSRSRPDWGSCTCCRPQRTRYWRISRTSPTR